VIPKVHQRGQSFKGVAVYLTHDKGRAETSERVAWTHTENIHTDDVEKAAKVMAWTDLHRDDIRAENGGSASGRKAENGNVYHRSLSWALGESPSDKHMRETALAYIKNDGLSEHQSFIVAHHDTDFNHLHIVSNLVHPETGLIHDVGLDKRRAQQWALEYEREHGIHVQTRIDNAEKRAQGEYIKDRDTQQDYSDKITRAYYASDNGQAFIHALREEGLELGKARRGDRNFVIVDGRGDIQKLSRQLQIEEKGKLKTQAIQSLLSDIDRDTIKDADHLAYDIKNRDLEQSNNTPKKEQKITAEIEAETKIMNEKKEQQRQQKQREDITRPDPLEMRKQWAETVKKQAEPNPQRENVPQEEPADSWDRDHANRQWEESIIDAGIEEDKQQKQREQWAQKLKENAEQERQNEAERLRQEAIHIDRQGSFADDLDQTRTEEAKREKEQARIEEIFGQQERNLEEGRKLGRVPLDEYDPPAPDIEPQEPQHESAKELLDEYERAAAPEPDPIEPEPDIKLLDEYEQAASPAPEIEQPAPEPQFDNASDMLSQYEQAATPTNDNTPDQGQSVEPGHDSGQSRDVGGYER